MIAIKMAHHTYPILQINVSYYECYQTQMDLCTFFIIRYVIIFSFSNLSLFCSHLFCRRTVPNVPPRIPERPLTGQGR